jgi:hypothetical protein
VLKLAHFAQGTKANLHRLGLTSFKSCRRTTAKKPIPLEVEGYSSVAKPAWFVSYQQAMAETHTGRCYCGAVEIEVRGEPVEMGVCHCENCRRYSAAPVSAFTLWKKENVNVTKGEEFLGRFKSSDISERGYCTKCGGHIIVEHPTLGLMDVRIGALRNFPFKPNVHLNYAETVLPMKDGLLKLKDFPAEIGGSGETLPE